MPGSLVGGGGQAGVGYRPLCRYPVISLTMLLLEAGLYAGYNYCQPHIF